MKGMKGKFLKKLKSIRPIGYLKEDRILQVNASDGFWEDSLENLSVCVQAQSVCKETVLQNGFDRTGRAVREPEIIDVRELMRDLEGEDMEFDDLTDDDKENIGPPIQEKSENPVRSEAGLQRKDDGDPETTGNLRQNTPLSEIDVSAFRRPDLNSGSLFDPNLLVAFQQAVMDHIRINEEERKKGKMNLEKDDENENHDEPPAKARRVEEDDDVSPLVGFEERCPPGGSDAVIFYTTSLRGIRKTFEECTSIRFLLESFRVLFHERDVSMHMEFREELWRILDCKALPPKLFIKGRYIGGAEQVLGLHEQGLLRPLFHGLPVNHSKGPCEGCAGIRFVVCYKCSGSRKVVSDDDGNNGGLLNNCPHCNENGLIICPICC